MNKVYKQRELIDNYRTEFNSFSVLIFRLLLKITVVWIHLQVHSTILTFCEHSTVLFPLSLECGTPTSNTNYLRFNYLQFHFHFILTIFIFMRF
jgi:hypothetical protein